MKVDMANCKVTTDGKLPQTGDSRNVSHYIAALIFILKHRKQVKEMK